MKAVAADTMTTIDLIRQRVEECVFGKCLVECSVEHRHLRYSGAESCACRHDALDVCRIVQRRELYAVFNSTQHRICYQYRRSEMFAAMDHTMSDRMNVADRPDSVARSDHYPVATGYDLPGG